MLEYIQNKNIDFVKWDKTILGAVNSRVYAESWYLDIVAPGWGAFVYGDYDYVMPVFVKKKFGFSYSMQVVYAQQTGVFPPPTPEILKLFIAKLNGMFPYYRLSFNSMNMFSGIDIETEKRNNYILSLNKPCEELSSAYNSHTRRHLRTALRNCTVAKALSAGEYLQIKSENVHQGFNKQYLSTLKLIMAQAVYRGRGEIYGAYDSHNELCSAAFFIREKNRFTYLNSVSSNAGKEIQSMYAVIDNFIKHNAGSPELLDFEGSNIEGIARFFKGFGATPEFYTHIKRNKLPWPIKLIKK